jgi:hypothetical protein
MGTRLLSQSDAKVVAHLAVGSILIFIFLGWEYLMLPGHFLATRRRTPEQEKPRASSALKTHVGDPSLTVTQGQMGERFVARKAEMLNLQGS